MAYYDMFSRQSLPDRLFERVTPEPNSGCWLFDGKLSAYGYGKLNWSEFPKEQQAHRVSYLIHKGDIPADLLVMHSCDQRSCINPDHLSVGTQKDNMSDAARKGRTRNGYTARVNSIGR